MTPEEFAIKVLGQEAYDHSPCQAHPYELVAMELDRLRTEIKRLQVIEDRYRWLQGRQMVGNQPGSWWTISDAVVDARRGEGE